MYVGLSRNFGESTATSSTVVGVRTATYTEGTDAQREVKSEYRCPSTPIRSTARPILRSGYLKPWANGARERQRERERDAQTEKNKKPTYKYAHM